MLYAECDVTLLMALGSVEEVKLSIADVIKEAVVTEENGKDLEESLPFSNLFIAGGIDDEWRVAGEEFYKGYDSKAHSLMNRSNAGQAARRKTAEIMLDCVDRFEQLVDKVIEFGDARKVGVDDERLEKSRMYQPRGDVFSVGFLAGVWEVSLFLRGGDKGWTGRCKQVREGRFMGR